MRSCTRCIMDTSDPEIKFDEAGVCNHCRCFDTKVVPYYWPWKSLAKPMEQLDKLVLKIKRKQKKRQYDAIIGVSGGVDSSYLAYWAVKIAKLRLLAVHVDAGWNSELAVQNIEKIIKGLGIDFYTYVIDWKIMRDMQLAFLKAGVANQDALQDHAFQGALYNFAVKNKIRYVLSGANIATESILPRSWGHNAMDANQIKSICNTFGVKDFRKFPLVSFFKYYIYWPYIKRLTIVRPLDYMDYNKFKAMQILENAFTWRYYGGKHYESRFTRFFQGYWLPTKFGYDKRKAHLSSLILSGQVTREQALREMSLPVYEEEDIASDLEYVAKKLGITAEYLRQLMKERNVHYRDYKNNDIKMHIFRILIFPIKMVFYVIKKLANTKGVMRS